MTDSSSDFAPGFAEVLVPRRLDHPFTYRIPPSLTASLRIGSRVRVPFGPAVVEGVIVALSDRPPGDPEGSPGAPPRLRDITGLITDAPNTLPEDLLQLTRLLAERYLAPWGQCLRLVLPAAGPPRGPVRYTVTDAGRLALNESRLSPASRAVLALLAQKPKGLSTATLRGKVDGRLTTTLATLKRRGFVDEGPTEKRGRSARADEPGPGDAAPDRALWPTQELGPYASPLASLREEPRLQAAIEKSEHAAFLLHTDAEDRLRVYFSAAELALTQRRSVLILAPETARAAAIAAQAAKRWGPLVLRWHGGLTPAARAGLWQRIHAGAGGIVVGTRSAVFAPLARLGLVCVDEEENPSHKEEQEPRYHAREVAWMRARQHQAVLLLGSSHPSVETTGRSGIDLVPLQETSRALAVPPVIHAVDIRHTPYGTLLSEPMLAGIHAALQSRAGVLLFLNRKGFAPAIQCRDCGQALQCRRCSVTLTFYRRAGRLACHYCGGAFPLPDTCPACQAVRLEPAGFGTEQLEEEVRRQCREARIARLDGDTARTPAQADAIRRAVSAGTVDILIGTQMLFQGSPLPAFGFVGLPHADAGLHRPDFRAAERTYHALLDAVRLARPGDRGGTVLLQTYLPTHHVIAAVAEHNPSSFYDHELESRRALGYPPFAHLINLCLSGKHEPAVKKAAQDWAARLAVAGRGLQAGKDVTILGPVPAAVAQARGRHRWQLLVKSSEAEPARQAVRRSLEALDRGTDKARRASGVKFEVDVDPIEMG